MVEGEEKWRDVTKFHILIHPIYFFQVAVSIRHDFCMPLKSRETHLFIFFIPLTRAK